MTGYWLVVFHQLMWGFYHLTFGHGLYLYYVSHHAIGFLNSGYTSGSGGRSYLYWLSGHDGLGHHGISPIDW